MTAPQPVPLIQGIVSISNAKLWVPIPDNTTEVMAKFELVAVLVRVQGFSAVASGLDADIAAPVSPVSESVHVPEPDPLPAAPVASPEVPLVPAHVTVWDVPLEKKTVTVMRPFMVRSAVKMASH